MKKILSILILISTLANAQQVEERNLFQKEFERCNFKQSLMPLEKWCPYPPIDGRAFWTSVSDQYKKYYISAAEAELGKDWPFLPAITFLEYAVNGNRDHYESILWKRQARLYNQVMAELIENKGRFMNDIVNGIWSFCEESSWCLPAHIGNQKAGTNLPDITEPIPDLGAGMKAAGLAWTTYLLKNKLDSISPLIRKRVQLEIEKRLLIPVLQRTDLHWMGYQSKKPNNWVPWICSNYIACVLLLENDIDKQSTYIKKSTELLDLFVNAYHDDGGCDEGPSYWSHAGGSMFDCLDFLTLATSRKFNLYKEPVIKNIAGYLPAMHIHNQYYVNFADASATIDYTLYKVLIYQFGKETGNDNVMQLASSFVDKGQELDNRFFFGHRLFRTLAFEKTISSANVGSAPYLPFYWFPGIQVMTARDKQGSPEGLFLAAQGGHNNESHNHNDVGNFIIYHNGKPLIIDVGVETYTGKTFGSERYTIWTMQSQYHNCPLVNGVMQAPGASFKATDVSCVNSDSLVTFSLDISKAYPDSAFVSSWRRTISYHRGHSIEINDNYKLSKSLKPTQWTFMSYPEPKVSKPGTITFSGSDKILEYQASIMNATIEPISIKDERLKSAWGDKLYRIVLTRKAKVKTESCTFTIK